MLLCDNMFTLHSSIAARCISTVTLHGDLDESSLLLFVHFRFLPLGHSSAADYLILHAFCAICEYVCSVLFCSALLCFVLFRFPGPPRYRTVSMFCVLAQKFEIGSLRKTSRTVTRYIPADR